MEILSKVLKFSLIGIALIMLGVFFLLKNQGGDIDDVYWRFDLNKMHLSQELSMPYFTPGRCGGFLLAADAQDPLFSVYMLINFLIPNITWAIKFGNIFLSLVFGFGLFYWLSYFGIKDRTARLFASFLGVFSGYWICHMVWGGHSIWAHGLAYLPWIMICLEEILEAPIVLTRQYLIRFFLLALLIFLLLNSGYYWLQVAFPVIVMRLLVSLPSLWKQGMQYVAKVGILASAFLVGLFMSAPRLAGIYEFQLKKFPRLGGEVPAMQVIGNSVNWLEMTIRSFFDPNIIIHRQANSYLAYAWDYSNYIGIASVVLLLIGLVGVFKIRTKAILIALVLAVIFQFAMTRTTHAQDFIRMICPIFKQISWYWRGSAIILLFILVCIGHGSQWLLNHTKKYWRILGLLLMLVIYVDIFCVQLTQTKISFEPFKTDMWNAYNPAPYPMDKKYAECKLGCIFGYGKERPPVVSIQDGDVYDSKDTAFFNIHDIRHFAMKEADGGYYLTHQWPLWPKSDAKAFDKYIHYKQVITVPVWLTVLNWISLIVWIVYCVSFVWVLRNKR